MGNLWMEGFVVREGFIEEASLSCFFKERGDVGISQ